MLVAGTVLPGPVAAVAAEWDIVDLDAVALRDAIATRRFSCLEAMEAYLARIGRLNPTFNAIVSLRDPDLLRAEARAQDDLLAKGMRPGPLQGFPLAPKDLAATVGIPTTLGSPLLKSFLPPADAIFVERLKAAGAIIIGKTNTPEFGLGSQTYNNVFGTTRNAYDPAKTAGGSSGGAAVALALRMLPVADGSDMMGSLRNPAGWNNVVGFRPSMGLVPFGPTPELFVQQLGYDGPMGRTVADTALLLSVMAGRDPRAPLSLDTDPTAFAGDLSHDVAGWRIGWLGDFDGYLPTEPGVLDLCRAGLQHLEALGCIVEEARLAFEMARLWRTWLTLRGFLVAGALAPFHADPQRRTQLKPEAVWEVENGLALTAADVYRASTDRSAWYRALLSMFDRYDALVLPTAQVFPFAAETPWPETIAGRPMDTYHRWMEVTVPAILAGVPVAAVPAGFDAAARPMGLQLIGRPRGDLDLLRLASAYERQSGFPRIRPPLP